MKLEHFLVHVCANLEWIGYTITAWAMQKVKLRYIQYSLCNWWRWGVEFCLSVGEPGNEARNTVQYSFVMQLVQMRGRTQYNSCNLCRWGQTGADEVWKLQSTLFCYATCASDTIQCCRWGRTCSDVGWNSAQWLKNGADEVNSCSGTHEGCNVKLSWYPSFVGPWPAAARWLGQLVRIWGRNHASVVLSNYYM